jgi:hypothetical protein
LRLFLKEVMGMKLRLLLLASLLLTAGLSVVACGDDQTVDTSGQPPVQVNLLASLSFMAEIVEPMRRILEEQESFVSMSVEDTTGGPAAGYAIFNKVDRATRELMIPWTLENDAWSSESAASGRFPDGVLGPPRVLLKVGPLGCSGTGTLDPDIVTWLDLDGKTLQGGSRPSARDRDSAAALGINVNHVEHGGDDVTVRELKSGQIDASYYHMTGHNRPVPQLLQLLQEQDGAFYFVDVAPAVAAIHDKFPGKWPFMFPVPLYKGDMKGVYNLSVDPIRGDVSHCFGGQNPYFAVSAEMDDAIAYEIVYQTVKNRADFSRFLAGDVQAITDTLGMTYRPQVDYHPGARAAFEDLDYPYGLAATIAYQKQRAEDHGMTFTAPSAFDTLLECTVPSVDCLEMEKGVRDIG